MEKKTNAVIYARVARNEGSANAIKAQVEACQAYAQKHGFNVTAVYSDIGALTERKRMFTDIEGDTVGCVIVSNIDRLARNMSEIYGYIRKMNSHGIRILSVAHNPENEAVYDRALDLFCSLYVERYIERAKK